MPSNGVIRGSAVGAILLSCTATCIGVGAPSSSAQSVYPDISQFQSAGSLTKFRAIDRDGLWLKTGVGLTCAIGDDGSYGCSGQLPGTQPGDNEVGWFPGDPFPGLYSTEEPRFDSGASQTIMPGRTVLRYHGSTCAVTYDQAFYCINGADLDSQILVTAEMTFRGRDAVPAS